MKYPFSLFSFFLIIPTIHAHENYRSTPIDTLKHIHIEEVVVSAGRFETLGITTPDAIRVLPLIQAEKFQIRSAPEALTLTPGVFVQKTSWGGGSPFVRGLTGNQTLLMTDGIRLNNSTMRYGPNQYFNTIDLFSLSGIEVLRGNGSVQYGSDAMGGTIHAFSRNLSFSDQSELNGKIHLRWGSHGMEKTVRPELAATGKRLAFTGGMTWRDFGDLRGGKETGVQHPTGYKEMDFDLKGKIRISEQSALTLLVQQVNQHHVPTYHKITLENYGIHETDPQQRQLAYARWNGNFNQKLLQSWNLTLSRQLSKEGRKLQKNGSAVVRDELDEIRTTGINGEIGMASGTVWKALTGFDYYHDLVNSSRTDTNPSLTGKTQLRGLYPDGSTMESFALFSSNQLTLRSWDFMAGARFQSHRIRVNDGNSNITELTPAALVGNVGLSKKITPSLRWISSLNTGFRTPNIDDLGSLGIVDFRYEVPDFDLKPEHSLTAQTGFKVLTSRLNGEIFLYNTNLTDLITRQKVENQTIEGYPVYKKENSDKACVRGFETAWDYLLFPGLKLQGSFTYTYGQNKSQHEPMRRIPPAFGRVAALFRQENWQLALEWMAATAQERLAKGDTEDNRIPTGGTPGWNVFNLNTGYGWRRFTLDLSLKNFFNADYRYHGSGINEAGRSAFVAVTYLF
ncbi:MAG TPA: TonB-dependent receptor [Prolixibacteraceae bacterium]|nr:TonB-dependent receptor [Prolixibacteraceae bacterium]